MRTFEFEISNSDSSKFGRKEYDQTGEIFSIKSLCRNGSAIYFADPVHNNIKAIDLETGKMRVSERLIFKKAIVNDIAIHGERILVSTDEDVLYVLNFDLLLIDIKLMNREVGSKMFLRNRGNLYIFSDPADVNQDNRFDVSVNALRVDNDLSLIADTLRIGRGYKSFENAKYAYEITSNDKCLSTTNFELCIDGNFPAAEYLCRNIFVNENSVSFFEFVNNKIRVVSVDVLR